MAQEPVFQPITVHLPDGSFFQLETEADKTLYLSMVTRDDVAPTPRSQAEAWRDRIATARRMTRRTPDQETAVLVTNSPAPVVVRKSYQLDIIFRTAHPLSQKAGMELWRVGKLKTASGACTYHLKSEATAESARLARDGLVEAIEAIVAEDQPTSPGINVVEFRVKEFVPDTSVPSTPVLPHHASSPELHYVTTGEHAILKVLRIFRDRTDGLSAREIFELMSGSADAASSTDAVGQKIAQLVHGCHPRPCLVEKVPGHRRYRLTQLGRTAILTETRYPRYKYDDDGNKKPGAGVS